MHLSQHFIENWQCRVGFVPTPDIIGRIVDESVRIQPSKNLRTHDGSHFRMLSIYWHPDLNVILKIDDFRGVAVTVLSRENFKITGQGENRVSRYRASRRNARSVIL